MNETELFIALFINRMAKTIANALRKSKNMTQVSCGTSLYPKNFIEYELEWHEMDIINLSLNEALLIIDDALCFGFAFKVEDGKVYYTEQMF